MRDSPVAWVRALLAGGGPFRLSWRAGGEHAQDYGSYLDAWLASAQVLSASEVEAMSLTDRGGRRLPFPAHAVLTWRWGSEEYSSVLRRRGQARRRLCDLADHAGLEFVSLTSPLGRPVLTAGRFQQLRSCRKLRSERSSGR